MTEPKVVRFNGIEADEHGAYVLYWDAYIPLWQAKERLAKRVEGLRHGPASTEDGPMCICGKRCSADSCLADVLTEITRLRKALEWYAGMNIETGFNEWLMERNGMILDARATLSRELPLGREVGRETTRNGTKRQQLETSADDSEQGEGER